jgi:hypothetical protein
MRHHGGARVTTLEDFMEIPKRKVVVTNPCPLQAGNGNLVRKTEKPDAYAIMRKKYGMTRADVEADIQKRIGKGAKK